jgi:hypothetical protein
MAFGRVARKANRFNMTNVSAPIAWLNERTLRKVGSRDPSNAVLGLRPIHTATLDGIYEGISGARHVWRSTYR